MIDLTGPPRPWSTRLVARFDRCREDAARSPSWWRTPAPRGERVLLDRLAETFGASADRTVVTGGVRQFATGWAATGLPAAVEAPTYADIPAILGTAAPVQRIRWSRLGSLARRIDPAAIVWLTSPYRNPDGLSLDGAGSTAAAALARRGNTVMVNHVYRWSEAADHVPDAPAGAWTVTSLAKVAGGGLRLGWATAPAADRIARVFTSFGPPTQWQRACAKFLDAKTFRTLWADCVEPTVAARQAFADRASELLGWEDPTGGPSMLLSCANVTEPDAVALLAAAGVRVSRGSAFDCPDPSVRLAFSGVTLSEAKAVAEVFARLEAAFRPSQAR